MLELSQAVTWDNSNIPTNYNNCPNDGITAAPIPANGVVFVQNDNSVTNLTAGPGSPTPGWSGTLTATVTSANSQIPSGATVSFRQTTRSGRSNSTATILSCAGSNWSTPVQSGGTWTSTSWP